MSQLTAVRCNLCTFVSSTAETLDLSGWATVGFIVRIRGTRKYEESMKSLKGKIKENLGTKLHVCPGCVTKFDGGKLNLRMIGEVS